MREKRQRRREIEKRRLRRAIGVAVGMLGAVLLTAILLHSSGYAGFVSQRTGGQNRGSDPSITDPGHGDSAGGSNDTPGVELPGNDSSSGSGDPDTESPSPAFSDDDLASLKVNELGEVMIIMYHDIQEYDSEWVRSRAGLRADLERFWSLGYSLIPLNDYLTGNINVPAGRAPLVLTFDDGTRGQLSMVEGEGGMVPDPDCAVGILLAFSREHPEFGHAATFFVNSGNPFGDAARAKENLNFLIENGMEVGNHTRSHENLAYSSPEEVAREIGSLANEIREKCDYEVLSLALPFGGYPKSDENLLSGTWDGQEYVNIGILLVGAEPAPSPFSKEFNPLAIPRIRGSQEELDKWLGEFEKYPDGRFVSDGTSETVTIRDGQEDGLDPDRVGDLAVRSYRLSTYADDSDVAVW